MRFVWTILRWFVVTLLAALFVGPFAWGLATRDSYMTVTGESMEPTYQVGDVLLVQRVSGDELERVGDPVVVTLTPGDLSTQYVHRVHEIVPGGAILKGDNNETADPGVVTPDRVVGAPRLALTGGLAELFHRTQQWPYRVAALLAVVAAILIGPSQKRHRNRYVRRGNGGPAESVSAEMAVHSLLESEASRAAK